MDNTLSDMAFTGSGKHTKNNEWLYEFNIRGWLLCSPIYEVRDVHCYSSLNLDGIGVA